MRIGQLAMLMATVITVPALLYRCGQAAQRAFRRWRTRRFLRVYHGGRQPMLTSYGELVDRPEKPPIRSLRHRGDDDAA